MLTMENAKGERCRSAILLFRARRGLVASSRPWSTVDPLLCYLRYTSQNLPIFHRETSLKRHIQRPPTLHRSARITSLTALPLSPAARSSRSRALIISSSNHSTYIHLRPNTTKSTTTAPALPLGPTPLASRAQSRQYAVNTSFLESWLSRARTTTTTTKATAMALLLPNNGADTLPLSQSPCNSEDP